MDGDGDKVNALIDDHTNILNTLTQIENKTMKIEMKRAWATT